MGHTSCGAVKAAAADAHDTPAVTGLVARIKPAVEQARSAGNGPDLVDRAVTENAKQQAQSLVTTSELLAGLAKQHELKIAVARYDLADGAVDWLSTDGLASDSSSTPAKQTEPKMAESKATETKTTEPKSSEPKAVTHGH
jgi:carbonic anhydrase